jgi:hypothetical protein
MREKNIHPLLLMQAVSTTKANCYFMCLDQTRIPHKRDKSGTSFSNSSSCVVADFRRRTNETCTRLGFTQHTAAVSYTRFGITYRLNLKLRQKVFPETSVRSNSSTLRDVSKGLGSHNLHFISLELCLCFFPIKEKDKFNMYLSVHCVIRNNNTN